MDGMARWLFLAFFVLMLATLVWKTPVISGPWLFLLRAFFPNWKFFHAVGYAPRLYARTVQHVPGAQRVWGSWTLIYPRRTRRWWHLFHNPDTNLGLAQQNLVHHLGTDINALPDGGDPGSLVTYGMVCNLVAHSMQAQFPGCSHFQFELRMELEATQHTVDAQTMLTSPVLPCP